MRCDMSNVMDSEDHSLSKLSSPALNLIPNSTDYLMMRPSKCYTCRIASQCALEYNNS